MVKIKTNELRHALEVVKPGLANKELIEQTTSFAFIPGKIITYNDKIAISYPIREIDFQAAVPAQKLYSLIKTLKEEEVTLELKDTELLIKCGKAKAGIKIDTDIRLPLEQIEEAGEWQEISENFVKGLASVVPVCSADVSLSAITCLKVNSSTLQATDNLRAIVWKLQDTLNIKEFLLPSDVVSVIVNIHPIKMSVAENWVHFKNEQGVEVAVRVHVDSFPDFDKILSIPMEHKIDIPEKLFTMMERATIFGKEISGGRLLVQVVYGGGKVRVRGVCEEGWYNEFCDCDYKQEELIEFEVTPSLFKDVFTSMQNFLYSKSNKMIRFEGKDFVYIGKVV